jgi:hypothetical protein
MIKYLPDFISCIRFIYIGNYEEALRLCKDTVKRLDLDGTSPKLESIFRNQQAIVLIYRFLFYLICMQSSKKSHQAQSQEEKNKKHKFPNRLFIFGIFFF